MIFMIKMIVSMGPKSAWGDQALFFISSLRGLSLAAGPRGQVTMLGFVVFFQTFLLGGGKNCLNLSKLPAGTGFLKKSSQGGGS